MVFRKTNLPAVRTNTTGNIKYSDTLFSPNKIQVLQKHCMLILNPSFVVM
jgi:hypothetical protein